MKSHENHKPMVGKRIAYRTYAHVTLFDELPDDLRARISRAIQITRLVAMQDFNVARVDAAHDEVSLLSYPSFFDEAFPVLAAAWRVHLPTELTTYRDYRTSLNPPVLHRKELLLPVAHPAQRDLVDLTRQAESIGLFDDPVRIGFRKQWEELIASKGFILQDNQFVPVGNKAPEELIGQLGEPIGRIERHRTALSRTFLSAPVQALIRLGVLTPSMTFFDYGCGRGDDLTGLQALGYKVTGWDPHFSSDNARIDADIVNIGFVINVIEDMEERITALQSAYKLARGALSVAAMLWSSAAPRGRPYLDGVLTSRSTFQRYYSQNELQSFVEAVLDEHAYPIAPGVFFVFKDRFLEQRFLVGRQVDPTRAPRLLARKDRITRPRVQRARVSKPDDPLRASAIQALWAATLELGRLPEPEEHFESASVISLFGTWNRALRRMLSAHDADVLEAAAKARANELRVFFAMLAFAPRTAREALEPGLKRDVRAFYGSLAVGQSEGIQLLKEAANPENIMAACSKAASCGLGFLDGDHSLQLHSSLVCQLDPVLRAYVGSATVLYGDVSSADLVKIHIQSGKVTLMKFDDFDGLPLPRLVERVKVKLREQDLDYFEYGGEYPPPLLFSKSRYINEEFPHYPEQLAFDKTLTEAGLLPATGHGLTEAKFLEQLRLRRRRISGFELLPAIDIPDLDAMCGSHFTYRQLVECSDTWRKTQAENRPAQPTTYNALYELATTVLDPVIDYFGGIELTYGFASPNLTKHIPAGISPQLDQHAACELKTRGKLICARQGAAVDFLIRYEDMWEVARWIRDNCAFDRMYLYGRDRPIHVSVGPESSGTIIELVERNGKRIPRPATL